MTAFTKRVFAFVLSLILAIGAVPAFAVNTAEATTDISMSSVLPEENVIRAAFTASEMKLNGLMTEEGWNVITKISENASFGVQWDTDNLYLAVRNNDKEKITVTLNGITLTDDNSKSKTTANKRSVEYRVSLETLGVTVDGYGIKIPAKVMVGDAVWEGEILFSAIDWFTADNANYKTNVTASGSSGQRIVHAFSRPTSAQGVKRIDGGYNLYDKYDPDQRVAIAISTYAMLGGEKFAPLGDRTADTVVEFDFHAASMPVYTLGIDNDFSKMYQTCGFNWYITDSDNNFIHMGIVNTENGLVFVIQNIEGNEKNTGPAYSTVLNRQVGETFRIGTVWTTDGDVIVYRDGEVLDVYEDIESTISSRKVNTISLEILRSVENAKSEADNIDVNVTNLAAGKYYGERMLDTLHFADIAKDTESNPIAYAVTADLTLPSELSAPMFPASAITWESSDPSVIDAETGKVTRPATNGKLVTLTATETKTGDKKSMEIYVKGLAPESDVLVREKDTTPYKGVGTVQDVHEFVFDTQNNSIIRDLKEPRTVNVIKLTDNDDINKLNEAMVTIWVSDDNKKYTQIPAFKMLRDGMYTYLYDFEATARYIKVHCTDCGIGDAEFVGPLDEMIEAYYEDVFGDGGSAFATKSRVTLTNDTDTAKFDSIEKISITDAGVKCLAENNADVRFYLDGEMLYHYFDGENFYIRVTKIPKNSSVTLDVISGNADAKDISNKANVYEIVYGTVETTYSHGASQYMLTFPDGTMMAFVSWFQDKDQFGCSYSTDQGRSWLPGQVALGSQGYLQRATGSAYDEATGRIVISGYQAVEGGRELRYLYSDDRGRTWRQAPLTRLGEHNRNDMLTYSNIAPLSCRDGDGPNVDYVQAVYTTSPTMEKYYNNGYPQCVTRVSYSTDNGQTWILGADEIAYYEGEADGEHAHIREQGTCEHCILEAKDGTVVIYMRCQFDNVYKLARSVSTDHGKTWQTHAELSDVYSVNCQPMLFNHDDNQFLLWAGNNMFGQASFRRYSVAIGVSYDNLMTFENTVDIHAKTTFQGLMTGSAVDSTNPQIGLVGDTLMVVSDQTTRIENFTDYFFRTRGAYDTFENTTTEYEGWARTGGTTENSTEQASDGKYSMRIAPGASAARAIPYLQNGTVAFDLFIEDVDKAKFEFELESAYGFEYGLATPVAFRLEENKATFFGADSAVNLDLKDGWNHFEFTLALQSETPAASLSVNGGAEIGVPVNTEIGNYICYVHVRALGSLAYYLDEFLVNDMDNAYVPDVVVSAEATILTEVPENLKESYADTAALTSAMQTAVLTGADALYTAENTAVYALSPILSKDGGDTWTQASAADIPASGMTVKLAYPAGTAADTHAFRAADAYGNLLTFREGEDGLYVKVKDDAPVILAWIEAIDAPVDLPDTDSEPGSSSPLVWVGIGAAIAVIAAAAVIAAKKFTNKQN